MPARFKLVRGVRVYADGREVCVTAAAWRRRRRERIEMARYRCECCEDCASHRGRRCNRPIAQCADVHHRKRRGLGGAKRDDRLENLEADCRTCHRWGPNK